MHKRWMSVMCTYKDSTLYLCIAHVKGLRTYPGVNIPPYRTWPHVKINYTTVDVCIQYIHFIMCHACNSQVVVMWTQVHTTTGNFPLSHCTHVHVPNYRCSVERTLTLCLYTQCCSAKEWQQIKPAGLIIRVEYC